MGASDGHDACSSCGASAQRTLPMVIKRFEPLSVGKVAGVLDGAE
jgi:hypothetical protein